MNHDESPSEGNGQDQNTEADRLAEPVDFEQPPRLSFPVVGIGASAGGLEAFSDFLSTMPSNSGIAFVLVQHLPPERESLMAEILSKRTEMPVREVADGMAVEADHVYIIRPGRTLTIKDGKLHLGEPLEKPGHRHPVDDFFRSLAEEQRERAICIVMSGMGSNGTAGAQAIKAVGGVCIAQDPDTAKFSPMPRALIESGLTDFVLRADEIPEFLARYTQHPYVQGQAPTTKVPPLDRQLMQEVLAVLRARTRLNFDGYKKPTVMRRIQRRMGLHQLTSLDNYLRLLRQNPNEGVLLADDLLIHVTGFFRDIEAWEALREKVIDPLVRDRESGASIRGWVSACSSGEEAYTLAMLIVEAMEAADKHFDVKIFATDTADRTLSQARGGTYPMGIEGEISADRLERFFDKHDSMYRVKKELRELVVFAPQNVLQDPPFSHLDVGTCRNLLIYLEPDMQRRILGLLHFGIREGGALFLGNSESVAGLDTMFEPIDKKRRIFRRIGPTRHHAVEFPVPQLWTPANLLDRSEPRSMARLSVGQLAQRALLHRFTPPTVVVDREQRIVYFHGSTQDFLVQPTGEPTRDLYTMLRDELRGAVRAALHQVSTKSDAHAAPEATLETSHGRLRVAVTASNLDGRAAPGYVLINFVVKPPSPVSPADPQQGGESRGTVNLEDELRRARSELQSSVEELQTSNEDLKAANEEAMSINEELQSTNEELETSKEELQSLNEELTTVNAQLHAKMEELEATTNDLDSLLSSTDIAVIFLDFYFRIRRFTPAAKDLIELIPSDVGRPIQDLARKFDDDSLMDDARRVLEKLVPMEREVKSASGRWYLCRVLPYRSRDNRIGGVVLTFVEISARKLAEEGLREAKHDAESANQAKDHFLAMVSHELRTPLSAIDLWSKTLGSGAATPEHLREAIHGIEHATRTQKRLIEDLIDSSRIVAGKLRLDRRTMNLQPVIVSAIDAIRPMADAKRISLVQQLDDQVLVSADSGRIEQVFSNLLANAVKFTPSGGRIGIKTECRDGEVAIAVTDNGAGIPPELLPHVFDRFRQAEPSSSRRSSGGLGLGLAIAKEVIEMHGGSIELTSPGVGQGVTATVHLALATDGLGGQSDSVSEQTGNECGPQRLAGAKILLVEDDRENRNALTRFLWTAGADVAAVETGTAALKALAERSIDLILCDIGLPDMDGFELIRDIRTAEQGDALPMVPAIALTAFAGRYERQQALESGFQDYLAKPPIPVELLNRIEAIVGKRDEAEPRSSDEGS